MICHLSTTTPPLQMRRTRRRLGSRVQGSILVVLPMWAWQLICTRRNMHACMHASTDLESSSGTSAQSTDGHMPCLCLAGGSENKARRPTGRAPGRWPLAGCAFPRPVLTPVQRHMSARVARITLGMLGQVSLRHRPRLARLQTRIGVPPALSWRRSAGLCDDRRICAPHSSPLSRDTPDASYGSPDPRVTALGGAVHHAD